jgi:hypothetical protein
VVLTDSSFVPLSGSGTYQDAPGGGGGNTVNYATIGGTVYLVANATTAAGTAVNCYFTAQLAESLAVGPFAKKPSEVYDEAALTGAATVGINFTLMSASTARLIQTCSARAGFTIGSYALDSTPFASPTFRTTVLSYPVGYSEVTRPGKQVVPFSMPYCTPVVSSSTLAAGGSMTMQSAQVTMSRVPSLILIGVRPQSYASASEADWFCSISNVNVQAFGLPSLLSDASQFELFNMARKNGVNLTWQEFQGTAQPRAAGGQAQLIGSVLAIQPGTDIPMPFGTDVGSGASSFAMQVQVTFSNPSSAAITPVLYVCMLYQQMLVLNADGSAAVTGLMLTEEEVKSASVHVKPARVGAPPHWGGGLWDAISKYASPIGSALGILKDGASAAGGIASYVRGEKKEEKRGGGFHHAGSRLSMLDRAM